MTDLPLTPHMEGVIETTKDLCNVLYRNGADIDLFFHCFLNDLSESCTSIFKRVDVDPKDLLKESRKVLSKKRKNKYTKSFLKTDLRKFFKEAERISQENFSLDYIPPEIILMAFFEEEYSPKVIKNLFPMGDEASAEVVLGFITESSFTVKDVDFGSDLENISTETPEDWIDMFSKNEILSQFAENLNLKALNKDFDKIVEFDGKIDEIATVL